MDLHNPQSSPDTQGRLKVVQRARNLSAIELLDKWMADDSGYDESVWPTVKNAIEENRLSTRRRFRE